MTEIFDLVYQLLKWGSEVSGLTYQEVNIIVYFILIPAFIFFTIGKVCKKKYLLIGFLVVVLALLVVIPDFERFSNKLFDHSVLFLNWFAIIGLDYIQASVVICVILPILLIAVLLYWKKVSEQKIS